MAANGVDLKTLKAEFDKQKRELKKKEKEYNRMKYSAATNYITDAMLDECMDTLIEFHVQIPISRVRGINIDTEWYKIYHEPIKDISSQERRLREYFRLVDDGCKDWKKLAECAFGHGYRTWYLWTMWFIINRDKRPDAEYWNNEFAKTDARYERAKIFVYKLLPEVERFSEKHYAYNDHRFGVTVDYIKQAVSESENSFM